MVGRSNFQPRWSENALAWEWLPLPHVSVLMIASQSNNFTRDTVVALQKGLVQMHSRGTKENKCFTFS